jgi:hypothetical protein
MEAIKSEEPVINAIPLLGKSFLVDKGENCNGRLGSFNS